MKKILFVDDEPNVLAAFRRQLGRQFPLETAASPKEGLNLLQDGRDFAVVVADMRMPEMNGVEFLGKVRVAAPEVVRLMLTGNADQGTAIEAINEGHIFRFLTKPCAPEKLVAALEAALAQHQLITAERELLENTLSGSVRVLAEILAINEPNSFSQSAPVRDNLRLLARQLKIDRVWELEVAVMLANIGQVTIPPEVALKVRVGHALTAKEKEMFANIPMVGGHLLAQIPRLEEVAKIILYQNKRFDGTGSPEDNISGQAIPLGARILRVLFDLGQIEAAGVSRADALAQLRLRTGFYDPQIIDALAACFNGETPLIIQPVKPPLAVSFDNLRVGHVLAADLATGDNIMIVSAGNRITPALIHRLRNFSTLSGIKEPIYVEA